MAQLPTATRNSESLHSRTPTGANLPNPICRRGIFHPEAQLTQCRRDFSRLNYPDESFRTSAKYLEFDDQIQEMSQDLVRLIQGLPPWQRDFPVVEPQPMEPVNFPRPVL